MCETSTDILISNNYNYLKIKNHNKIHCNGLYVYFYILL